MATACVRDSDHVNEDREHFQYLIWCMQAVAYPGILFGGGGSTNSDEDRENGDLGA